MKYLFVPLVFFLFVINFSCATMDQNKEKNMKISKEEAIVIANKEATRLTYEIAKMKIIIDENNSFWNQYINSGPILESNPFIKDKLANRDFWAVYYAPNNNLQLGGDLFIFVDKKTGEIIFVIPGK